jgi:uncharacterized protein (DUF1800 family)
MCSSRLTRRDPPKKKELPGDLSTPIRVNICARRLMRLPNLRSLRAVLNQIRLKKAFCPAIALTITVAASAQTPSTADVVRFLDQATFGPNQSLIAHVQSLGFEAFLEEQFALPPSSYPNLPLQPSTVPTTCTGTCVRDNYTMYPLQVTFFNNALTAPDQLRQRVAFALQQIMVASGLTITQPSWMSPYLQVFANDAFGNFRQLLSDITLNPAMGEYLNMAGNNKSAPNENYGREVLQLFTIGLNLLNNDGSIVTDSNGNPVPSYTQPIVDAFSRVFTGWNLAAAPAPGVPNYTSPMVLTPGNHDGGAKTLLNGVTLAAVSTVTAASATKDLNDALDNIFQHRNVGPFIGRNLIEHLVTSNPSPAYISRVTAAFNDNGSGVRGDMKAVVRAILLDPEARNPSPDPHFGHLVEPAVFVARFLRAFNTTAATTDFVLSDSYLPSGLQMGEDLFRSPSVFNFYPPSYNVPFVNINGPEFAIQSNSSAFARVNFIAETTYKTMPASSDRPTGTWIDVSSFLPQAGSPFQLTSALNTLLTHNAMSPNLQAAVNNALAGMSSATPTARIQRAVYLIASSPEYFVER